MSFRETYRSEVLQSRRDKSRRAFFWSRIIGLALMLTIGATLRSEPELRRAVAGAGMDAVMAVAGRSHSPQRVAEVSQDNSLPTSHVKVNRFGNTDGTPDQTPDAQAIAQELARTLATRKPAN